MKTNRRRPTPTFHPFLEALEDRTTPATFTVINTGDAGAGNGNQGDLRYCVDQVNLSNDATNLIDFAIGQFGSFETIVIASDLTVSRPATLDGTSQGTDGFGPLIQIQGAANKFAGLVSDAGGVTFKDLAVFDGGTGIRLANPAGTAGDSVISCFVGTDHTGTAAGLGNFGAGVLITGGDNTVSKCLISGNGSYGVDIQGPGAVRNTISGCLIGTDATGHTALPNALFGVAIRAGNFTGVGTGNTIGAAVGTSVHPSQQISGNGKGGVQIDGGTNNQVLGNAIGVASDGTTVVANNGDGVQLLDGASSNIIGPNPALGQNGIGGATNIISGNTGNGVDIEGTNTTKDYVFANYIGVAQDGKTAVPNGNDGVLIVQAFGNTVGGQKNNDGSLLLGNVISGNKEAGVEINSPGAKLNTIQGNFIGTDKDGGAAVPNAVYGVKIDAGAANNTVVVNVISGNGSGGVLITDQNTTGNKLLGNYIGTDLHGAVGIGNKGNGVLITAQANGNTVGGAAASRNWIDANTGWGVETDSNNNVVDSNYIGFDVNGNALKNTMGGWVDKGVNNKGTNKSQ
jgi:titin